MCMSLMSRFLNTDIHKRTYIRAHNTHRHASTHTARYIHTHIKTHIAVGHDGIRGSLLSSKRFEFIRKHIKLISTRITFAQFVTYM